MTVPGLNVAPVQENLGTNTPPVEFTSINPLTCTYIKSVGLLLTTVIVVGTVKLEVVMRSALDIAVGDEFGAAVTERMLYAILLGVIPPQLQSIDLLLPDVRLTYASIKNEYVVFAVSVGPTPNKLWATVESE